MQKSIRENSVKSGGITAVTANSNISDITLIDTLVAKQQAQVLYEKCLLNTSEYGETPLYDGQQTNIKHLNVGLGRGTWLTIEAHLEFLNTADADVYTSETFPFNILKRFETDFNGNNKLHNLSGYQLFGLTQRRYAGMMSAMTSRSKDYYTGHQVCGVTKADTPVLISSTPKIIGQATPNVCYSNLQSCKVSATKPLDFYVNFYVPFVLRDDIPIGLVPLQNNNIHGQMILTMNTILQDNVTNASTRAFTSCLATASKDCKLDPNKTRIVAKPCLEYLTIPNPMALDDGTILAPEALYSYFTNTSYLAINTDYYTSSTGQNAFNFAIPNNYLLMAISATMFNSQHKLLDIPIDTDNWHILINNSLTMGQMYERKRVFKDFLQRMTDAPNLWPAGMQCFDFTQGVDTNINNLNTVKWLNLYDVNNPVFRADIKPDNVTGACECQVLMESLVPGNIALV